MLDKKIFYVVLCYSLFIFLSVTTATGFAASGDFSTTPTTNHGKRWRIGYLQGGDYGSYQRSLVAMVEGLVRLGWMEDTPLPLLPNDKDTSVLWKWLATGAKSDYLEFVADGWYESGWDKKRRKQVKEQVLRRLNNQQDIDLMLALGTWAGQDLANNDHHVPTLVASTTDPLAAGIISSVEDSGYDHIHAKVDPERHKRQVRLFKDIFDFDTLGIVYEKSDEGRGFGAIASVEAVAEELGFKLHSCNAKFNDVSQKEAEANVVRCYAKLAEQVDAVYITRHPGVNLANLPRILAPQIVAKKPTFAQGLSDEVEHGVLLSISLADFSYIGDFYAQTLSKIFNGAKPRQLVQRFQNPPKIAINLKTAQQIGYDPSVDILGAADEIYTEVAVAKP